MLYRIGDVVTHRVNDFCGRQGYTVITTIVRIKVYSDGDIVYEYDDGYYVSEKDVIMPKQGVAPASANGTTSIDEVCIHESDGSIYIRDQIGKYKCRKCGAYYTIQDRKLIPLN